MDTVEISPEGSMIAQRIRCRIRSLVLKTGAAIDELHDFLGALWMKVAGGP